MGQLRVGQVDLGARSSFGDNLCLLMRHLAAMPLVKNQLLAFLAIERIVVACRELILEHLQLFVQKILCIGSQHFADIHAASSTSPDGAGR